MKGFVLLLCGVLATSTWGFAAGPAAANSVSLADAYAHSSAGGKRWTIGAKAVELVFDCSGGKFVVSSFRNKLNRLPVDYSDASAAAEPFPANAGSGDRRWKLNHGVARQVAAGGRPAVELDLSLSYSSLNLEMHLIAYPGASVVRRWTEVENAGSTPLALDPTIFWMGLRGADITSFTDYWMVGGNSGPTLGMMRSAAITEPYHQLVEGEKTHRYVPWMAVERNGEERDGWFVALEYLGKWKLSLDHDQTGPASLGVSLPELAGRQLAPGERLQLPIVTLGVFHHNFDDLGERLYNWQYEYLWDYTRDDWYALMPFLGSDFYQGGLNLQENFAGRLGWLDMGTADMLRRLGLDILWDDAGWAADPDISKGNVEGPDFAQTQRYVAKMGMKWALWFAGRPSSGVMDSNVGSWGDFQWRTDAVGDFDLASDREFRGQITHFREAHPRSSFHTCDGGSSYSHTFDIQRYGETHYLSDLGRGDQTNYYLSFLEPPDRWIDIVTSWNIYNQKSADRVSPYDPGSYGEILSMVPSWFTPGPNPGKEEPEYIQEVTEIYHYLLREGVAGRWSYMLHPAVTGDAERYYMQRTRYDRTKACIIVRHTPPGPVVIKPQGLLPEHQYVVSYEVTRGSATRSGADLMSNGITLKDRPSRELVYLGMPDHPGSGADKVAPQPPSRVLLRRETNIGQSGVGIYWSPGSDNNWISYYEVRRGSEVLDKVRTGAYDFDHSPGWDPSAQYSVRTVDGDGNASAWTVAQPLPNEPWTISALGALPSVAGEQGWSAETTTDGNTFTPMQWVAPEKSPFMDFSPNQTTSVNQRGGFEGYWEGADTARVGRGWQQASTSAMSVRTWTVPRDGTVRIIGRAIKEYYRRGRGDALRVSILRDNLRVWPAKDWASVPADNLEGAAHDFVLQVTRGEAIRFVLKQGASPKDDLIVWMPRIVYVDDPPQFSDAGVVRIKCGSRAPYTDSAGNPWSADRYYQGGEPVAAKAAIEGALPSSADQELYRTGRQGHDFTYSIPVPAGVYAVRLKFAEPAYQWSFERPIELNINGRPMLHDFDIVQSARGPRRAHERIFRYLVPDGEGRLVLHFTGGFSPLQKTNQAIVQAIEVLPEFRPAVRIDVGARTPFVDWDSFLWSADTGYQGGHVIQSEAPVTQATPTLYDQSLYRTARSGRAFSYRLHMPPGLYIVHLKFAELWLKEPGQRPMNIDINGLRVRESWDPAEAAGKVGMAADIRAEDITPDKDGTITIRLTATGKNEAILQGIEVE